MTKKSMPKRKSLSGDFYCSICLMNHPIQEAVSVKTCRHHCYCEETLQQYVSSQVNDAVTKIRCPHPQCNKYFRDDEVSNLTSRALFRKYKRFKTIKEYENYRECPACSTGTIEGSEKNPSIKCKNCSHCYCFIHGDGHKYKSCKEYEIEIQKSRETILKTTRACPWPSCKYRIEKNGGCPSMRCKCGRVRMTSITSVNPD